MRSEQTVVFVPEVVDRDGNAVSERFISENLDLIVQWYNDMIDRDLEDLYDFTCLEVYKSETVKNGVCIAIGIDTREINTYFFYEYITDPDDDGNYPLLINDEYYYIYYKENNSEVATKSPKSPKTKTAKAKPKTPKSTSEKTKIKRAPSSYILFTNDMRQRVKEENPNATFGEMGKILGSMWAKLKDSEKAYYTKKSNKLKAELNRP